MSERPSLVAVFIGIASGLTSAAVTGFLLLINGSFVLAMISSFADSAPSWMVRDGVLQFILFTVPLIMVVVEWMTWDLCRSLVFRERPTD